MISVSKCQPCRSDHLDQELSLENPRRKLFLVILRRDMSLTQEILLLWDTMLLEKEKFMWHPLVFRVGWCFGMMQGIVGKQNNPRKSKSFWLLVYSLLSVSSIAAVLRWKYNWQIWNCKQQLVHMVSVQKRNIAQKKGIALTSRSSSWSGGSRGHLQSVRVVDGRGVEDKAVGEHLPPLVEGGALGLEEDVPFLQQAEAALLAGGVVEEIIVIEW